MADEQRIVDMWELADRIEDTPSTILTEDERVIVACAVRWFAGTKTETGKAIGVLEPPKEQPNMAVIPVTREQLLGG
jgi:hypothetical protein